MKRMSVCILFWSFTLLSPLGAQAEQSRNFNDYKSLMDDPSRLNRLARQANPQSILNAKHYSEVTCDQFAERVFLEESRGTISSLSQIAREGGSFDSSGDKKGMPDISYKSKANSSSLPNVRKDTLETGIGLFEIMAQQSTPSKEVWKEQSLSERNKNIPKDSSLWTLKVTKKRLDIDYFPTPGSTSVVRAPRTNADETRYIFATRKSGEKVYCDLVEIQDSQFPTPVDFSLCRDGQGVNQAFIRKVLYSRSKVLSQYSERDLEILGYVIQQSYRLDKVCKTYGAARHFPELKNLGVGGKTQEVPVDNKDNGDRSGVGR